MNAPRTLPDPAPSAGEWQNDFLTMLPRIETQLRRQFRGLGPEAAEEAVQEGVANCLQAFVSLHRKNRREDAYPSVLARFAAQQVGAGRKVGSSLNADEPLSEYAQRKRQFYEVQVDRLSVEAGKSIEAAIADRYVSIPERVALRIDMPRWLQGLSRRMRQIAKDLAIGCTTTEVAAKYGVTAGRISQIRRELYRSWQEFHWAAASGT